MSNERKVTNLAVKRDGSSYTASWKVPSSYTKSSTDNRWTSLDAQMLVVSSGGKTVEKPFDASGISTGATTRHDSLTRSKYYPYKSTKLKNVTWRVRGRYSGGSSAWNEQTYTFKKPYAPKLTTPTFNGGGNISAKVSVDDAKGRHERAYVTVKIERTSSRVAETGGGKPKVSIVRDSNVLSGTGKGEYTITYDEASWNNFATLDEYIDLKFTAVAKGVAGKSTEVSKTIRLCFPDKPVINGSVVVSDTLVRVPVKIAPNKRKVAKSQLQVGYSESEVVTSWEDVEGAYDDNTATAFTVARSMFTNDIGEHVFVRIKNTYLVDSDSMAQFSEPVEVTALYRPSASGEEASESEIAIEGVASPDSDTESLNVTIGWANDVYNATEISWSDDPGAWRSTKEPSSFVMPDLTWDDGQMQGASMLWPHSTTVKVSDLDESTRYHFRARRYRTTDDLAAAWTAISSGVTGQPPAGVIASAPSSVAIGSGAVVSWTVGGGNPQTAWAVMVDGIEVAGGTGGASSYMLPASRLEQTATVNVSVSTGGEAWYTSPDLVIGVFPVPEVSVTTTQTITALPHSFTVTSSNAPSATAACRLVSRGVSSWLPDGEDVQDDGDELWSGTVQLVDGTATASIELAEGVHLIDGGDYALEVVPTANGVTGEVTRPSFDDGDRMSVAWAHQAAEPSAAVAVDADALTASIEVEAPEGAAATDVYDVYRLTADNVYLIAAGIADGATIIDRYAPYCAEGGTGYRIATRTADGDVEWADFWHVIDRKAVRFDWPGGVVELPYDISIGHKVEKGFDSTVYLDGTKPGAWDGTSALTSSISVNLVKLDDMEQERAIAELGRYAGGVFVRDPAGHAYEANVTVDSVTWSTDGVAPVSITADEIDASDYIAIGADAGGEDDVESD